VRLQSDASITGPVFALRRRRPAFHFLVDLPASLLSAGSAFSRCGVAGIQFGKLPPGERCSRSCSGTDRFADVPVRVQVDVQSETAIDAGPISNPP